MQINHCVSSGPSAELSHGSRAPQAPPPGRSFLQEHSVSLPCFASFQWFLAPMDSSGCPQWRGDTGVDVVSLLSRGTVPVHPFQSHLALPSAPKTASNSCWDHSEGLVVITLVVTALVVTSSPATHSTFSSFPTPLCCFHRSNLPGKEGFFLTLWLFPSLLPQPMPIPAPDPTAPGGIPSLGPVGCSWL